MRAYYVPIPLRARPWDEERRICPGDPVPTMVMRFTLPDGVDKPHPDAMAEIKRLMGLYRDGLLSERQVVAAGNFEIAARALP